MLRPDVKHLRAVTVLAEERHFSRAATRLRIGQSGLTKQIVALESMLGFALFRRDSKHVALTEAGEIFAAEARLALEHLERAINLSRLWVQQAGVVIHVGKSPYTDPYLITKLLSLRLPLFPDLQIQLTTRLSSELAQDLLDGSVDMAFLTGFPETPRLSGSLVADQSFWIAMLEDDPLARQQEIAPTQLPNRPVIIFDKRVAPFLYEDFIRKVRPASAPGCALRHVMTAEDASQLVLRGFGVAVLTQAGAWRINRSGITVRPFISDDLRLKTRIVARSDNTSKLLSDVIRGFVKSLASQVRTQISLPLRG